MTRDELEQLDTRSLRALARQHLAGQARLLRSRPALIAALAPRLTTSGADAASVPGGGPLQRTRPGAPPVGRAPTPDAAAAPAMRAAPPPATPASTHPAPPAEGLVQAGFFVVRARARPRSLRPAPATRAVPPAAEAPPAQRLPPGDDLPHLLARDPTTLFLFWDFRRDLERGAAFGLSEPRVVFRLFDGDALVRTVEVPLGRRSLYLEGLEPGHVYSVEAWFADGDGHARPTGRRSAPLRLAPAAPSPKLEVRMVRVPWEQPLAAWREAPGDAPTGSRVEPLDAPARVDLPASLDWQGGGGPGPRPGPGGPRSGRP